MIHTVHGDILTARGLILHGVNCQGKMGRGLALSIKKKWPFVHDTYVDYCKKMGGPRHADDMLGNVLYVNVDGEKNVAVANCFIQDRYGNDGKKYASYDALDLCMKEIGESGFTDEHGLAVNFPMIGCGLGGLQWSVVEKIIDHRLPFTYMKVLWLLPNSSAK